MSTFFFLELMTELFFILSHFFNLFNFSLNVLDNINKFQFMNTHLLKISQLILSFF